MNPAFKVYPMKGIGQILLIQDITAMSIYSHENKLPQYLFQDVPGISWDGIQKAFIVYDASSLQRYWDEVDESSPVKFLQQMPIMAYQPIFTKDRHKAQELKAVWEKVIFEHLGLYLRYKFEAFRYLLGFYTDCPCWIYDLGIPATALEISLPANKWRDAIMNILSKIRFTFVFRAWLYLGLGLFLLCLAMRFRQNMIPTLVLFASGWIYIIPYYFIGLSCDFRYVWWLVLATLLMLLFIFSTPKENLDKRTYKIK